MFIPILPASLLDFLTAPTPFLMGVHTSYQNELPEIVNILLLLLYTNVPEHLNFFHVKFCLTI